MFAVSALSSTFGLGMISRWRSQTPKPAADCIHGEGAQHWVYLHGLDSYYPGWQDQLNREAIRALAQKNNASLALLRGNGQVLGGRGWISGQPTANYIDGEAARCFGVQTKYRVLGFSNGAYVAGEFWKYGNLPNAIDFFLVGGAPPMPAIAEPLPTRSAYVLVGADDKYNGPFSAESATRWQNAGAPMTLVHYEGGHRFLAEAFSRTPPVANIRAVSNPIGLLVCAAAATISLLVVGLGLAIRKRLHGGHAWHRATIYGVGLAIGALPGALVPNPTTFCVVIVLLPAITWICVRSARGIATAFLFASSMAAGATLALFLCAFYF